MGEIEHIFLPQLPFCGCPSVVRGSSRQRDAVVVTELRWWQSSQVGLWGRVITPHICVTVSLYRYMYNSITYRYLYNSVCLYNCIHLGVRRGRHSCWRPFPWAQEHTRCAGSSVGLSGGRIHQDPKGHAPLNRRYMAQLLSGRNCNQVFKHVSCRSDHRKE